MRLPHILIVEDNEDSRELLADLLSSQGYPVATAENGEVALRRMRDGDLPALMLLDLTMPVMDGWQLHSVMRADQELNEVPVIIVSAVDGPVVPKGSQGLLPKPIEFELLFAIVKHYCGPPPMA
jgi:CheY-like chemotaxis protein